MEATEPVLRLALNLASKYLDGLREGRVSAAASLGELRQSLHKPLNEQSLPAETVIEELVRDTRDGLLGCAGGRFFAWAIGGALPAALAADWLTAVWDQNAALYACGPAAAVVEEVAGDWLKDLLGLPMSASFAFVSGCQMAHVTCLAAARHALLAQRGWDVERQGLCGAPPIRVLTSNRHGSVERAVRLLGMGADSLIDLPLDGENKLLTGELESALARDPAVPTIVILQAGDLNAGQFDDYRSAIPVAKKYHAWVHVDGAFGLWVAASPVYRHLLTGVAAADSWATDGHKWLNVPYDCGYAFVAHPADHTAAMSHRAPYLVHDLKARDQIDWTPEWSRRARGFATYAALRELGRQGVANLVERCCAHARKLMDGLAKLPQAEVLWQPQINQGLVRFGDDAFTDSVIEKTLAHGVAFFQGTTWRGMRAMRVSVLNWQTTDEDVERAIRCVADVLRA